MKRIILSITLVALTMGGAAQNTDCTHVNNPKWILGTLNGKTVRVKLNQRISFIDPNVNTGKSSYLSDN